MDTAKLSSEVTRILEQHLRSTLPEEGTIDAQTHPAWDSLQHINIVLDLEEQFQVRFEAEEIPRLRSRAHIVTALASKVGHS